jgi:hypothetical protein
MGVGREEVVGDGGREGGGSRLRVGEVGGIYTWG